MNLNLYPSNEHDDIYTISDLTPAKADEAFKLWCACIRVPFVTKSRVTLTDPLAGNRIIRDTDQEVFGFAAPKPE